MTSGGARLVTAAAFALCTFSVQPARAQIIKDLDVRTIIDVGPVDVPGCTCVAKPMTLPAYPIDFRWGTGPAAQLRPGSRPERERASLAFEAAELQAQIDSTLLDAFSGNGWAAIRIAMALGAGVGLKPDEANTLSWFMLAAADGNDQAPVLVAYRLLQGTGAPADPAVAAQWFQLAANLGISKAMVALGLLYASGQGDGQDFSEAVRWWNRAGQPVARRLLADAHACGLGTNQDARLAASLYRQSMAAQGMDEWGSRLRLALMYRDGCGVERDEKEAIKLLEAGANSGDPESQVELSEMLLAGASGEQVPNQVYTWASFAALRLPKGALRDRATKVRDTAARLMTLDTRRQAD